MNNRSFIIWSFVSLAWSTTTLVVSLLSSSSAYTNSFPSKSSPQSIFSLGLHQLPRLQPSVHRPYQPVHDVLPSWILRHSGTIAPFHPLGSYEPPPETCKLVQVNQLQRHGSRYPTHKVDRNIRRAIRKLKNAVELNESLRFIEHYRYRLAHSSLIPLGASESFQAGLEFGSRYGSLIDPERRRGRLPFIRASRSHRVIDSANNFTNGLFVSLGYDDPHQKIKTIHPLLISEDPKSNNTLDNNSCPNRESSTEKKTWLEIFGTPITDELSRLAPGSRLHNGDTLALMQLCIFESLAEQKLSRFCDLFKREDWVGFGYYYDLDKYYGHGVASRLGRLEGLGYVSELLSRLEADRKWVDRDRTKVNQTLDRSPTTFPLDRQTYIDFSHDNQMISIFAALGLQENRTISESGPARMNPSWNASDWMGFGSRLTIEKLVCFDDDDDDDDGEPQQREYVRFMMNDRLIPILNTPTTNANTSGIHESLLHPPYLYRLDRLVEFYDRSLLRAEDLYQQCSTSHMSNGS